MVVVVVILLAVAILAIRLKGPDAAGLEGDSGVAQSVDVLRTISTACRNVSRMRYIDLGRRFFADSPELTIASLPTVRRSDLTPKQSEAMSRILTDPASYNFSHMKSMRFYADHGLEIVSGDTTIVILISDEFKGGRLVMKQRLLPRQAIFNLDQSIREIDHLLLN